MSAAALKLANSPIATRVIARYQLRISPNAAYIYALQHNAAPPVSMRRLPNYAEVSKQPFEKTIRLLGISKTDERHR